MNWPLGAAVPASQRPAGLQCNSTGLWHVVLRFDYNQPAQASFARQAVERMALVDSSTGWRIVSLEYPHDVIEVFALRSGWPGAAVGVPTAPAQHPFDALPGLDAPMFSNPAAFDTVEALRRELERANAELLRSERREQGLRQALANIAGDLAPVAMAHLQNDPQALHAALRRLIAQHVRVVSDLDGTTKH